MKRRCPDADGPDGVASTQLLQFVLAQSTISVSPPLVLENAGAFALNTTHYPGYCSLVEITRIEPWAANVGIPAFRIFEGVESLQCVSGNLRCQRHGPFSCSCRLVSHLGQQMINIAKEFSMSAGTAQPTAIGLSSEVFHTFIRRNLSTNELCSWHDAASCQNCLVVCEAERQFAALFALRELPLPPCKRVVGPFAFQVGDTFESLRSSIAQSGCSPTIQLAPSCVHCGAFGQDLRRCCLCMRFVCPHCVSRCDHCGLQRKYCQFCVVTVHRNVESTTACITCVGHQ